MLLLYVQELINTIKKQLIKPNAIITVEDYSNGKGLKFRFIWVDDMTDSISYIILRDEYELTNLETAVIKNMIAVVNKEIKHKESQNDTD